MAVYLIAAVVVLIESDWNLKDIVVPASRAVVPVLIESDWNLKEAVKTFKDLLPILY